MMIGLGQIPTLGNTSRVHEMRLFQEVARVDEKEAEQGAIHSDVLKLGPQDKDGPGSLNRHRLASKISNLWRQIKAKTSKKEEAEEQDPVAKARANSVVGENAPLGWLTFDQLSEEQREGPLTGVKDKKVALRSAKAESQESFVSFLREDPEDNSPLYCGEWFLSPNG